MEIKLDLEQKLIELQHKQDMKFLDQKKEFAAFSNDNILEDRFNKLEAKVYADYEKTRKEFQVSSVILTINFTCYQIQSLTLSELTGNP